MNFLLTLGSRIRSADPHHFAIFRGMAAVTLFVLVGKLMSAAKEMAVAYRYGLGAEVDAYHFVFNLVSWPVGIWASVLTAVLVPLAVRLRNIDQAELRRELPRFRSELLGMSLLLGVALAIPAWIGMRAMLYYGWGGLPPETAQLAASALPGMVLLLPLGILVTLQSAWLLSMNRHINTLLESVPALFICLAVLVYYDGGIAPLVWGTMVGTAFHLLSLLVPLARSGEIDPPRFALASPQWPAFWQGFGIMLAGQALMSLTVIVDQFFAVGLGTGSVATLGYANRLLSLILGLAAIAVARATLPVFSQAKLDGIERMHAVATYWTRLMFLLGLVAMAVGYLLAPWAVQLLYERGAFTTSDTAVVAEVLRYALPQLPFYFCAMVLVSYAHSQRRYALIFWSGVIGLSGKVIGNLVLVPLLGLNGVALATLFVYAGNALFFWLALGRSK